MNYPKNKTWDKPTLASDTELQRRLAEIWQQVADMHLEFSSRQEQGCNCNRYMPGPCAFHATVLNQLLDARNNLEHALDALESEC